MSTAEHIRGFIDEHLLEEPFHGDDPLAEAALDSLAIEQLIDFLEEEDEVLFSDEELAGENFASVPIVAALVDAKRQGIAGPA